MGFGSLLTDRDAVREYMEVWCDLFLLVVLLADEPVNAGMGQALADVKERMVAWTGEMKRRGLPTID